MKNTANLDKSLSRKRWVEALLPSWVSLLLAIILAFGLATWVITSFTLQHSGYAQLLGHPDSSSTQPSLTLPGQNPPGGNTNSLQSTLPLIAFWGAVGLVVYFIVQLAIDTISNFKEFNRELYYVHAKRDIVLRNTRSFLIYQILTVVVWLYFLDMFFKWLIPDSIMLAHDSVMAPNLLHAIIDVFYSCLIIIGSMHLNTIFLRIAFRRPRVLTRADNLTYKS
jgi:hypothetical protein